MVRFITKIKDQKNKCFDISVAGSLTCGSLNIYSITKQNTLHVGSKMRLKFGTFSTVSVFSALFSAVFHPVVPVVHLALYPPVNPPAYPVIDTAIF